MGKVFISYSRKDKKWREELEKRFDGWNNYQKKQIKWWSDEQIKIGDEWEQAIARELREGDIIVMLLSNDFRQSKFIAKDEVPIAAKRAKQGKVKVMSLLVRPTHYKDIKALAHYQVFHAEGKAMSELPVPKREKKLNEFAEAVRSALDGSDAQHKKMKSKHKPKKRVKGKPSQKVAHNRKQTKPRPATIRQGVRSAKPKKLKAHSKTPSKKTAPQHKPWRTRRDAKKVRRSNHVAIKPQRYARSRSGLALVADIVRFSDMHTEKQEEVVGHLMQFLAEHQLAKTQVVNLFGDLAMVAFPQEGNTSVKHSDVVAFAQALRAKMKEEQVPLRIGLHEAEFYWSRSGASGHAFGPAVNLCKKMRHLGSANTILVSEDFVHGWVTREGPEKVLHLLHPASQSKSGLETFRLPLRNGTEFEFRVLKVGEQNETVPQGISFLEVVKRHITDTLKNIESAFVTAIARAEALQKAQTENMLKEPEGIGATAAAAKELTNEEIDAKATELSTRVSLLVPSGPELLSSTTFRYHRSREVGSKTKRTLYSTNGQGSGPPGRAFVGISPRVLAWLPNYESGTPTDKAEYVSKLTATGLTQQTIEGFGRKARAFIDFPFALAERPDGVICVDCMQPLVGLSGPVLETLAENLRAGFAREIAFLWELHQRP